MHNVSPPLKFQIIFFPEDILFNISVYLTLVTSLEMSIYYKSSKMYPSY